MLRNTFLNAQSGPMAKLGVGSMVTNYGRPRTLKWRDSLFDNQSRQP